MHQQSRGRGANNHRCSLRNLALNWQVSAQAALLLELSATRQDLTEVPTPKHETNPPEPRLARAAYIIQQLSRVLSTVHIVRMARTRHPRASAMRCKKRTGRYHPATPRHRVQMPDAKAPPCGWVSRFAARRGRCCVVVVCVRCRSRARHLCVRAWAWRGACAGRAGFGVYGAVNTFTLCIASDRRLPVVLCACGVSSGCRGASQRYPQLPVHRCLSGSVGRA